MCIIGLGFFIELASLSPSVYHAAMHRYCFFQDVFEESIPVGMFHRIDTSLCQG